MELRAYLSIFFLLCTFGMNAQSANTDLNFDVAEDVVVEENWTFFADNDQKLLYVDLELLGGYATDLVVENAAGDVVITEELLNIPKNAIYEVDLSSLESGNYALKIRTYQDVVLKSVEVK